MRGRQYVRTKPRRSLGFYVALRLYIAHVRIQLEKRAALKAFRARLATRMVPCTLQS